MQAMKPPTGVDGKRKRRWARGEARAAWYARHRAQRFARRFGF